MKETAVLGFAVASQDQAHVCGRLQEPNLDQIKGNQIDTLMDKSHMLTTSMSYCESSKKKSYQ